MLHSIQLFTVHILLLSLELHIIIESSTDEDRITNGELKALGDLISEVERHISRSMVEGDGGAGLLAVATARKK